MKVVCVDPRGMYILLTAGKQYEVIKEIHNSYIIKRDDDSIDKVDKSRFRKI